MSTSRVSLLLALVASLACFIHNPAYAGSVTLAWDANPEPDIAGYKIHYGTSPGSYQTILDVGNTTTTVVPSLDSGQTYYFAATAYNTSALESDYSNEISFTVPLTNQPPEISGLTQLSAQKETTTSLSSLEVDDPDYPNEIMQVILSVGRGRLAIDTSVANGVTGNQVFGNDSLSVQVSAPLSAIRTTFAQANGLTYTGNPNLVGNDTLQVSVTDSGNEGYAAPLSASASIPITVTGDAFDDWRNQYFTDADLTDASLAETLYGDGADPGRDGIDNLMEYALGLDPLAADTLGEAVQMAVADAGDGTQYATLVFKRRKNATELAYLVEVSADRQSWASGPGAVAETGVEAVDEEFEATTYQDLTAITPDGPRFLRLRVVRTVLQ